MPARTGMVLVNRFEILALAGAGGMGRVFRARDLRDGKTVAVKTVRRADARMARLQAALEVEAAALGRCRVRGIPRLVARGRTPAGAPFIAMRWCGGRPLSQVLHEERSAAQIVEIVLELLRIVGAMHARGWIHGDINASNLLVRETRRGRLRIQLVDLGLARRARPGEVAPTVEEVCGTPSFMAPELLRGAPTSVASDLYAVGALLYALLTRRAPFAGSSPGSIALRVATSDAEVICDCGRGLVGALLRRALHRDPALRFRSAREMQGAVLAAFCEPAIEDWPRFDGVDPYSRTVRIRPALLARRPGPSSCTAHSARRFR